MKNAIITGVLSLLALTLLFVGFRLLLDNPDKRSFDDTMYSDGVSLDSWDEAANIEEVVDTGQGDVVNLYNYKFRVHGSIYEVPPKSTVNFKYFSAEDGADITVTCSQLYDLEGVNDAIKQYFEGDHSGLHPYLPVTVLSTNITCYMQDTPDGTIPILYNAGDDNYYMFVPAADVCLLLQCKEMMYLTYDAETVIFGNPKDNPMTSHTYNMYERTAVENTRRELTDGEYSGSSSSMKSEVDKSSKDYSSEADNTTRRQMITYAGYRWDKDGTSKDTSASIDITSATAKASEWVLTSTSSYSFTDNDIRLHTLKATRNADMFVMNGSVTNQLSTERPYVVLIKFLNSEGELLYVGVSDNRPNPIDGSGVAEWEYTLTRDSGVDLYEIYSIMFEVY